MKIRLGRYQMRNGCIATIDTIRTVDSKRNLKPHRFTFFAGKCECGVRLSWETSGRYSPIKSIRHEYDLMRRVGDLVGKRPKPKARKP